MGNTELARTSTILVLKRRGPLGEVQKARECEATGAFAGARCTPGELTVLNQRQAELRQRSFKGKIPTQADPATTSEQWRRSGVFCWPLGNVCSPKSLPTLHPRASKVGHIPAPPSRRGVPGAELCFPGRGTRAAAAPWRPL